MPVASATKPGVDDITTATEGSAVSLRVRGNQVSSHGTTQRDRRRHGRMPRVRHRCYDTRCDTERSPRMNSK